MHLYACECVFIADARLQKAAAPPPDVKMTDAPPPKNKDKKEEKDKDSSSEADLKPAAVASSPEQPAPVESPIASEVR